MTSVLQPNPPPAAPPPAASASRPGEGPLRIDERLIAAMIEPGARVLDVGCGDGDLLAHLAASKGVDGRGLEISQAGVSACVARGLAVIQGDADADLKDYPSGIFDVAILAQTLQACEKPEVVLSELSRIGRSAIVSLPNFGHWRVRLSLALNGRMPVTEALPEQWYRSANIHLCTLLDFHDLCDTLGLEIVRRFALDSDGQPLSGWRLVHANLFAEQAVYQLRRR